VSLALPIDRWPNRVYFQPETTFGAASTEPVRELTGKSRFSYQPVHGAGGERVGIHRQRVKRESGVTHWQGGWNGDYHHGALAAELIKLLLRTESQSAASGLTTYLLKLRNSEGFASAKLGVEYEPSGPFYILHGVVLDSVRLTATAKGQAKIRFDFKAARSQQIASTRDYTHEDETFYGQYNFRTETVAGPCYEDADSGLSCSLLDGDTMLATEDGFVLTTEDGFALLLDAEPLQTDACPAVKFHAFVNGMEVPATEASFEWRETKQPARFGSDRLPQTFRPGAPMAAGELALYMTGDTVPNIVAADSEVAVRITADFGGGRTLDFNAPRAKFSAGTPDLVGRGELVYRAPFSALEDGDASGQESRLRLVI